ncbi:MAG: serine protein kinase RIO, partial [Pseudomonadota bacterium]|nr:serine protein kinase RIO [Pseudomonadota bacterium]
GELSADIELTGKFDEVEQEADVDSVMEEIKAALEAEQLRQERLREAEKQD